MDKQFVKAHEEARRRFLADPSKCYQRHIREVWAEQEPEEKIESLKGAVVRAIDTKTAAALISKHEWLATRGAAMGAATKWCYGLFLGTILLGVACFNKGPINPRNICGPDTVTNTVALCRGACVPHAPANAASFLIRHACQLANREYGFEVFFAYSDPDAGEIGTVYQAVGWKYLGVGTGRKPRPVLDQNDPPYWAWKDARGKWVGFYHSDFEKDGKRIKTYSIHKTKWLKDCRGQRRARLRAAGYREIMTPDKYKWVWFEGPNRKSLEASCRWPFLPYPKRKISS